MTTQPEDDILEREPHEIVDEAESVGAERLTGRTARVLARGSLGYSTALG
jgi:hypothetical protein